MLFPALRILLIVFVLFSFECKAQKYGYINYTPKDGLLSSTVYCMSEDVDGRLWFGTLFGVSVFNGNGFENIDRDKGLKETEVFLTYQDSKKRVWFITFGNEVFYYEGGKVKMVKVKKKLDFNLHISRTKKVWEDQQGNIWLLGMHLYRITNDSLTEIKKSKQCYSLDLKTINGVVYHSGSTGLHPIINDAVADSGALNVYEIQFSLGHQLAINDRVYSCMDNHFTLFGFENKILGERIDTYSVANPINRICVIDNRFLWILTHSGALKVDMLMHDTLQYLPGRSVSDVHIDKEKCVWLTTLDEGVFRFSYPEVKILDQSTGLSSNNVMSVCGDADNVWFGSSNGFIYKYNSTSLQKIMLLPPGSHKRVIDLGIENGYVYCATDNSLFKVNSATGEKNVFFPYISKCINVRGNVVASGSPGDCTIFDEHSMRRSAWYRRTTSLYILKDGSIAVGTLNGLFFTGPDLQQLSVKNNYQLDERINYIREDASGLLWIATHNNGVFVLDGKESHRFSVENGLLSNSCRHIYINKEDNSVWISTNKGVNKIKLEDLKKKKISLVSYTSEDGLPSDDVNQCFVRNDTLWAATSNGLAVINTGVHQPLSEPGIAINNFAAGDSIYSDLRKLLVIPYGKNGIEISFSGLSLSAGKLIRYKYRLNGLESKWSVTTQSSVRYASLSPGNYRFEVAAVHPKGLISTNPAFVVFTIEKPFWQTWWFYLTTVVFFVVIISAVFIYRLKQIRSQEHLKNRLLQSEITSIRSQMNPHFIFNSLNSIQDFIFKNDKEHANEYLTSFSQLMRLVLENSSSNYTSITSECNFLSLYLKLEQLRLSYKFEYIISVDSTLNADMAEIPTMILQPVVENALLHGITPKGGNGLLTVKFSGDDKTVTCCIEDNGVGRSKFNAAKLNGHNRSSFGLQAIRERVKILNSMQRIHIDFALIDLENSEGQPAGTRVLFTIS